MLVTAVLQKWGFSANLNICSSISPPSQSRKTLCPSLRTTRNEFQIFRHINWTRILWTNCWDWFYADRLKE